MSTFQFRLEKVLTLRRADRQQRRSELTQALQAERILASEAESVNRELTGMQKMLRGAAGPGSINVGQVLDIQRYELLLRGRLQKIAHSNEQLQLEIQRRRERLVEADQQVRVLEKLRERQQAADLLEQERREVRLLDEVAQTQVRRARK